VDNPDIGNRTGRRNRTGRENAMRIEARQDPAADAGKTEPAGHQAEGLV
jgi:hypothetical protein